MIFDFCRDKELVVNLDLRSIDGYSLGDKKGINEESVERKEDGYSVYIVNGQVDSILVCFRDGYRGIKSFKGKIINEQKEIAISSNSTLEDVVEIFGRPDTYWNDGVGMSAEYENNGALFEFSWDVGRHNKLDYLMIETRR